ncbi:MAG: MFS transporter [Verrucomicrobia bacterium]|nr:MFS transporter [Verrucomicrobiota bacterium]
MSTEKRSMFVLPDGRNVVVTFALVSSLFLLWGFCNGMIDVMDKHFQEELHLTLAQSAWVQFAHYLGYFLMALPAGWLAIKLGYRGGIVAGLLMVAAGGFWFIPATRIAEFWAFLLGVCLIAAGLTFLETIANPYTTVLGDRRYAATRINLAQSCNGIGWVFGPIAGSLFFYGKDAAGRSTGAETLWIPYAGVGVVVLILAVVFLLAPVPDIKTEDDYHLDDDASPGASRSIWKHPHFVMAVVAQFFYVAAQAGIFSFFINYMTSQVPPIPAGAATGALGRLVEVKTAFAADELPDPAGLAERLTRPADPLSAFLATQLSEQHGRPALQPCAGHPGVNGAADWAGAGSQPDRARGIARGRGSPLALRGRPVCRGDSGGGDSAVAGREPGRRTSFRAEPDAAARRAAGVAAVP